MRQRIFATLFFMFILIISLGACQTIAEAEVLEDVDIQEVLVIDNDGREISIYARPERVLTFGPNCTELLVSLGLSDYIIGHSLRDHSRGPLPQYADIHAQIPELAFGSATREAVLASGADFIYGIDWEFGGAGLDIAELALHGITVYVNSAQTIEAQFQEILDIGRIFQIEARAEAFVNAQRMRIQAVEDAVRNQAAPNVLVYDHGASGVFTVGGENFAATLIAHAGGRNLFDDVTEQMWFTASFEEVLYRAPDIILILDYGATSVADKIWEMEDSILQNLPAVQEGRFVVLSLEDVLPGNRIADAIEHLAAAFFPDLFE